MDNKAYLPFVTSGGRSAALGLLLLCRTKTPICGSFHAVEDEAAFWMSTCFCTSAKK